MSRIQILSVRRPFDNPEVAHEAIAALSHGDSMGLLSEEITCLDRSAIVVLARGMAEAGIGRDFAVESQSPSVNDPARLTAFLKKINHALTESPVPAREWQALEPVLGLDLLARLLRISISSARRYHSAARATPDQVAARVHYVAFVVGALVGAYNDIGVRRWFDRPRRLLDGSTPARLLGNDWSPDDEGPRRVRELANSLGASVAT